MSKLDKCRNIFDANVDMDKDYVISQFILEGECTPAGAKTYYLKINKERSNSAPVVVPLSEPTKQLVPLSYKFGRCKEIFECNPQCTDEELVILFEHHTPCNLNEAKQNLCDLKL